jgi:NOL1/NOP2/sun family putative RNA methylase
MDFPAGLEGELRLLMGDEYGDFLEACGSRGRDAFRLNTIKASGPDIGGMWAERVPWCPTGYFAGVPLGDSVEHFLGLLYLQDAASMLPAEVLSPDESDLVLDMAAAPGGKTTHLSALMGNRGCVVANEPDYPRLKALRFNLARMGVVNAVVTCSDGAKLSPEAKFTKILLDAPCSNAGQLASNPEAAKSWSPTKSAECGRLQRRLIGAAARLLAEGGTLVYSTCTYSPAENEAVVDYAVEEHGLAVEPIRGRFRRRKGLMGWDGEAFSPQVAKACRIYPQDYGTGGFFAAKLRK